jgi:hypothetical protein
MVLGGTAAAWGQDDGQTDRDRSNLRRAEQALEQGDRLTYTRLRDQLQDYPLYPYLRFAELGDLKGAPEADLVSFLSDFPDTPWLSGRGPPMSSGWPRRGAGQIWRGSIGRMKGPYLARPLAGHPRPPGPGYEVLGACPTSGNARANRSRNDRFGSSYAEFDRFDRRESAGIRVGVHAEAKSDSLLGLARHSFGESG